MEENKKISIVIPLYNGEKYIRQTLENILRSSYRNLEIIIINDGSTDQGLHICETIRKKDPRIMIYTKENGGIVSARNYGAAKATGDFLCFCDQDDFVEKDCYAKQIARIEHDQSDICMCSVGRSINGKISAYELSEDACYRDGEILKQLLYPLLFNGFAVPLEMDTKNRYPHIWSCMFRMGFWKKHQFLFRVYINFEDDLLLKVESFSKAAKISTLSHIGYYWRVNLKSETYLHKYIENIADRQQKCYEDLYQSLSCIAKEPSALELFRQVTFCKQYLDAIHNLLNLKHSVKSPKTVPERNRKKTGNGKTYGKKFIYAYFHETIYQRDFKNCIRARKYVKNGRIKPTIILSLLSKKWTLPSYCAEAALDRVLLFTLHSQTLTKLERMLKGIRFP